MKRTLIALGVIAATVSPLTAQANPKLYGKLHMSVESRTDDSAEDNFVVQSNDSRIGVRGDAELSPTLSAVYGIEWAVAGDTAGGAASDLIARNRFVGIKHNDLGTLKLGAYDTYLKLAQGKVDLFNDQFGDMKFLVPGESRASNAIGYESPKIADAITINVMLQPGEQTALGSEFTGIADGISTSVVYDNQEAGLYLALAMDKEMPTAAIIANNARHDGMRVAAAYKISDLTLSAIYGNSEVAQDGNANDGDDETGYQVGAAYKMGNNVLKFQYGMAEADAVNQERSQWSLGIDHNLTSKTRAFAFYTLQNTENTLANTEVEKTSLAFGVEHNF